MKDFRSFMECIASASRQFTRFKLQDQVFDICMTAQTCGIITSMAIEDPLTLTDFINIKFTLVKNMAKKTEYLRCVVSIWDVPRYKFIGSRMKLCTKITCGTVPGTTWSSRIPPRLYHLDDFILVVEDWLQNETDS